MAHAVDPNVGQVFIVDGGGNDVNYYPTTAGGYNTFAGDVYFEPRGGYSGTPPPVTYRIVLNSDLSSTTSTYTVTVTKPAPPVSAPLSSTRSVGAGRQYANTSVIGGNPRLYFVVAGQRVETVTIAGKGVYEAQSGDGVEVSFNAEACAIGPVPSVQYVLEDQYDQTSALSTYTPHLTAGAAPAAGALTSSGVGAAAQTVTALQPNCPGTTTLLRATTPVNALTLSGVGSYTVVPATGVITFTPAAGFTGTAPAVSYRVTDNQGLSGTGTYTATVTPPAAPTANALTSTGVGTAAQRVNATVPSGGTATLLQGTVAVTTLTVTGQGTYSVVPSTGAITFVAVPGFLGSATPVSYRVADTYGQRAVSTYTPTVTIPAPPAAVPLTSTGVGTAVQAQQARVGAGRQASFSVPTSPNTVTITGQGSYVIDPASGAMTFTPQLGFLGTATTVGYEVTDAYGQSTTSTYTATVTPPAPPVAPPVASTAGSGVIQQQAVPIPIGGSITLLAGNVPVASLVIAGQGTYSLDAVTGVITFTPVAGFVGTPNPVAYRVMDAYGQGSIGSYAPVVTGLVIPVVAVVPVTPTTAVVTGGGGIPVSVPAGLGAAAEAAPAPEPGTDGGRASALGAGLAGLVLALGGGLGLRRRRRQQ